MRKDYWPLLIAAAALAVLPFILDPLGLPLRSSIDVVVFAIACLGLNVLVGYTGLVSFGHGAWFGLGAYAAALSQLHWFPGGVVLPTLFAIVFVAVASILLGALILRRRGVYFSLLTLALTAMLFAVAYRWTALTGGESGLGGVVRANVLGLDLSSDWTYYWVVAGGRARWSASCCCAFTARPSARVLVAIRENEQRARFLGYPTNRYKLVGFVVSATVVGLAGVLSVFNHRFASAEPLVGRLLGRIDRHGGDRRDAQLSRAGARRALLHPVSRVPVDLDPALAVLFRHPLRRLHHALADRPGRRRAADHRAVPAGR